MRDYASPAWGALFVSTLCSFSLSLALQLLAGFSESFNGAATSAPGHGLSFHSLTALNGTPGKVREVSVVDRHRVLRVNPGKYVGV